MLIAIGLRCLLLFSIPNFSDDFYRFIWDGEVFKNGISPFLKIPSDFNEKERIALYFTPEYFARLNSPNFYSVYPPICQSIFFISAKLTSLYFIDSSFQNTLLFRVVVMKLFLLFFEFGSIYCLHLLQHHLKLSPKTIFIYALNPLVILELVGNCHFEPAMIFFLLASLYALFKDKWVLGAIFFAFSVSGKLLTLMLLPFFVFRLGIWRGSSFVLISFSLIGLLFLPFINFSFAENLGQSIGLFFRHFEFNAGIYLFMKELLLLLEWYSIQMILGKIFGLMCLFMLGVVFYWFVSTKSSDIISVVFLSFCIYFLLAVVVHPWYLTTLVALASLSSFRFPIAWSSLSVLSYSAYSVLPYHEKPAIIILEYILVLIVVGLERKKLQKIFNS
ncbi:MAG: hypothetical protein SFU91_02885 [Chloroherpetonaceae bacterium]|nr:hypothetical protein [Chloroherpetonaceae bacterium]